MIDAMPSSNNRLTSRLPLRLELVIPVGGVEATWPAWSLTGSAGHARWAQLASLGVQSQQRMFQSTASRDGLNKSLPNLSVATNETARSDFPSSTPRERDVVAVDPRPESMLASTQHAPIFLSSRHLHAYLPARLPSCPHRFNIKPIPYFSPHTWPGCPHPLGESIGNRYQTAESASRPVGEVR